MICIDIHCLLFKGLFKKESRKKDGNPKQKKGKFFLEYDKTNSKNVQHC